MSISKYPIIDIIIPNTPGIADLTQDPAAATWYTLVDITSGRGILNRVRFSNVLSNDYSIRFTIDGTATTIASVGSISDARGDGGQQGAQGTYWSRSTYIKLNIYFYTSAKVEIKTDSDQTTFNSALDYALEV